VRPTLQRKRPGDCCRAKAKRGKTPATTTAAVAPCSLFGGLPLLLLLHYAPKPFIIVVLFVIVIVIAGRRGKNNK